LKAQSNNQRTGQIRIIGGQWRGRKLPVLTAEGLRPTTDRVRETLFNWLAGYVNHARCLDLFAGSGALGLEALSRGAEHVSFIEKEPAVYRQLSNNLKTLDATHRSALYQADAFKWLEQQHTTFDIVFIDPPFHHQYAAKALQHLVDASCLAPEARVYLEQEKSAPLPALPGVSLEKEKTAGEVRYMLYHYTST